MDFKKGKGSKKKVSISIGFCLDRADPCLCIMLSLQSCCLLAMFVS